MLPRANREFYHASSEPDFLVKARDEAQDQQPDAPPLLPQSLTVLLDTTNQCDLRCRMCHFSREEVSRRPSKPMPRGAFQRIAREVFPAAHTIFLSAAAEPLIHRDFPEFLQIVSTYHPRQLIFLTNAQRLTPEISAQCLKSGVSEIHVSIDGATSETYEWMRRNADFQRLIDNLSCLQRLKKESRSRLPLVQFNIALTRRNVTELGEFARLAVRLGGERIACRHLILFSGLELQNESLFADKSWANEQMARQLEEMARYEVDLVHFPDFFSEVNAADNPDEYVPGNERTPASRWHCLPHRLRWALQSSLHQLRNRCEERYPVGAVEFPFNDRIPAVDGTRFSGWALHRNGVERIVISRKPLPGEGSAKTDVLGLIEIGEASRKNSLRADLRSTFPGFPESYRAEWDFHLPKSMLPSAAGEMSLFVIAWGRDGSHSILGKRVLLLGHAKHSFPVPFCSRPFNSVYIDSSSNVYPYPDCLNCSPFGSLGAGESFSGIWQGKAYQELRRRILEGDPPAMCSTCPDFVNRRVDDPSMFTPRIIA